MVGLFSYPKRKLKKLVKEGEYKDAIEFGNSIESEYSKDPDFLFIMGSIYYILEDAKTALHYFDRALGINDKDTETLLLKAHVHAVLKENQSVIDCCNKILNIDPDNKQAEEILKNLDGT